MPDRKPLPARWSANVFDDFRNEMDTLMSGFFGPMSSSAQRSGLPSLDMSGVVRPSIDIRENDKAIVLTAELPGMTDDQVDLDVKDGVLHIKGEKQIDFDDSKDHTIVVERSYGSFERSFTLPERVDIDAIKADFDKGVLVVTMPKKKEDNPSSRNIKIGK